jgi:squalene cyclase
MAPMRKMAISVVVLMTFAAGRENAAATAEPERSASAMLNTAAEQAIERGLRWLAARQHEDGSFGTGAYRGNVAICGLAGMALIASGSAPGRGPYGGHINHCLDYVLANTQQGGYIIAPGAPSHGPMYGHGFASLFLAECYGMSSRPELREKLAKAIKLIVNTQNDEGGWRYYPQRADADISVTVCQVMTLRAAKNAGLFVPNQTIERSVEYVKRSQNKDGGFMYMLQGGESAFPRSAAAVVALQSAGIYEGPEIQKALDYLMEFIPRKGAVRRENNYFEYGHYYAAQAMWHAGGEYWQRWFPAVRDELLARQREDGSWSSPFGGEYATAMCLLVLQLPNGALPIFQR